MIRDDTESSPELNENASELILFGYSSHGSRKILEC